MSHPSRGEYSHKLATVTVSYDPGLGYEGVFPVAGHEKGDILVGEEKILRIPLLAYPGPLRSTPKCGSIPNFVVVVSVQVGRGFAKKPFVSTGVRSRQ